MPATASTSPATSLPLHDLTVLTTGLHVALELLRAPGITVIMPGGPLWRRPPPSWGIGSARPGRWELSAGFLWRAGLSLEEGLTDAHLPEVELKRRLIGSVREVNVILDGSKVGKVAFASCAAVEEIDRVYTTPTPPTPGRSPTPSPACAPGRAGRDRQRPPGGAQTRKGGTPCRTGKHCRLLAEGLAAKGLDVAAIRAALRRNASRPLLGLWRFGHPFKVFSQPGAARTRTKLEDAAQVHP